MGLGQNLLDLQELDLSLMRDRATLQEMPVVAELTKKRRAYLKLKAEQKRLFAERKDIETDLSDLDADEDDCKREAAVARREVDGSDFRAVQDLEIHLSSLAKELDKIGFARKQRQADLKAHAVEEKRVDAYVSALEDAIREQTRAAREQAGELQVSIERDSRRREELVAGLPADMLVRYEAASKRFGGLAVEELEGEVPTVCRTALQSSSLSDLSRAGEVGECPYCHRILVVSRGAE